MGIVVGPQDAVACEQCFESTRSYFAFLYHDIVSFLFALFPVARRGSAADCTRTLTHGCSNSYLPVTVPAWDIYAMGTGCGDDRHDPTPSLCIIEHLFQNGIILIVFKCYYFECSDVRFPSQRQEKRASEVVKIHVTYLRLQFQCTVFYCSSLVEVVIYVRTVPSGIHGHSYLSVVERLFRN